MLANDEAVGTAPGAEVGLSMQGVPNPNRAQVEHWLRQQEIAGDREAANRHSQIFTLSFWGVIFAGIAAGASLVAAWPVIKEWLR
jgi:hypothetical protein